MSKANKNANYGTLGKASVSCFAVRKEGAYSGDSASGV